MVFVLICYLNFRDPKISADTIADVSHWRISSGHALNNYDAVSDSSLTSRVCGLDQSLSVSGAQMELYSLASDYLMSEEKSLLRFFNGQTLCIVALICWFLMVLKELNHALALHRATLTVPSDDLTTIITDTDHTGAVRYTVKTLTRFRRMMGWLVLLYRFTSGGILLYVGITYLVNTIDIEELILNAVALGIILDIDDLIFDALATAPARHLVACLKPLPMPSLPRVRGIDCKSFVMFVSMVLFLVYAYVGMLLPMEKSLEDLRHAMCGNNKEFVWVRDSRSMTLMTATTPFASSSTDTAASPSVEASAIAEAIQSSSPGESGWAFSIWVEDAAELSRLRNLEEDNLNLDRNAACVDLASSVGPYLQYLREFLEDTSIQGCSDARSWCGLFSATSTDHRAFRVRMLCPQTCGCDAPDSEQLLTSGCPSSCPTVLSFRLKLRQGSCTEDVPSRLRKEPLWISWVGQLRRMALVQGDFQGKSKLTNLADAMWDWGCGFGANLTAQNITWGTCRQWNSNFAWNFRSPAYLCPISCLCTGGGPPPADSCPQPLEYHPERCPFWQAVLRRITGTISVDVQNHRNLIENVTLLTIFTHAVQDMLVEVLDNGIARSDVVITTAFERRLGNLEAGDQDFVEAEQAARRLAMAQLSFSINLPTGDHGDRAMTRLQNYTALQMTSNIAAGMLSGGIDTSSSSSLDFSVISSTATVGMGPSGESTGSR
eukprot:TRINITY_DN11054_c0_g1_i2.p1 TRINITY_DN11054_c0_g1~~TRINITY_DN11054_c0_g1_i2.p1  ORF type:complete len:718 (+),score=95.50 TRINITY_DN11054_c0_g1_i2:1-2154(+)